MATRCAIKGPLDPLMAVVAVVITVVPTENAFGAFVSYTGEAIANATPPADIDISVPR